jgi:hypothetical protein
MTWRESRECMLSELPGNNGLNSFWGWKYAPVRQVMTVANRRDRRPNPGMSYRRNSFQPLLGKNSPKKESWRFNPRTNMRNR